MKSLRIAAALAFLLAAVLSWQMSNLSGEKLHAVKGSAWAT